MDREDYFGNYALSQTTLDNLRKVESLLERDGCHADAAWNIIKPRREKEEKVLDERNVIKQEIHDDIEESKAPQLLEVSSTQFFFSQKERDSSGSIRDDVAMISEWSDVAESFLESLESTSETLQLVNMKNLSDDEAESVIKYLSEKLSLKGTYNLCHSLCAMSVEQSMRYIRMTCSNLLLPKIIDLDEPSRLMSTVIHELVEKFPEDVHEFIYIPMLNAKIQDTSVFSAIIDSYPPQRKNELMNNFLVNVHELKEWHIGILSQLITSKILENVSRDKLLDLLLEKASIYSRDKKYGRFVLYFMKLNVPFSDGEKRKLSEIVAVNETIFRRVMENLLKNMYLYGDLWHIA